eukprot:gene1932-2539_t
MPSIAAPPKAKLSFKQKHALETLPKTIAARDAEISRLQALLADPKLYTRDPKAFADASAKLTATEALKAKAEDEWLELEAIREQIEAAGERARAQLASGTFLDHWGRDTMVANVKGGRVRNAEPSVGRKGPDLPKGSIMKHAFFAGVVASALTLAMATTAFAADISGAGATFPYPIYAKWAE